MMKTIVERIAKLVDLKSILTVAMIGVFLYICIESDLKVSSEQFVPLVVMILTFYFAKSSKDKAE